MSRGDMEKVILLVDDDDELRNILSVGLQKLGHPIHGVENTYLAKQWLASHLPALILLDLMMPDGNGLDLCRWIRSQDHFRTVPILISSGIKDEETVQDALDLGAVDFVRKPCPLNVLEEKIKRLLKEP